MKHTLSYLCRACCLITLSAGLLQHAPAAGNPEKTQKFIAVLQSNAGLFEKARACQQLSEIGTKEAVPALAALLSDEQLSAYARSGLEGIPDTSAAEALRAATATLKGNQLIGAINSLGVLRDAKANDILRKLANDPSSGVVQQSLLALGRISTDESIRIVRQALADGPEQFRPDAAAACLLAGEKQLNDGQSEKALALYEAVRTAKVPLSYRVGATRGAILARKEDRIPFLVEQLRSEEPAIRNAALLTIREIPSDALASALNTDLEKASPELQLLLLSALVDCHNQKSITAIGAKVASNDPQIRKTALTALSRIGGPAAAGILLQVINKNITSEEVSLAVDGLKQMQGKDIDGLILTALPTATESQALRVQLINLTEARGLTNATSELLKQAAASDGKVSQAALAALGTLAGPKDLPALITFTGACSDDNLREAAGDAIVSTSTRTTQTAMAGEAVLAELKKAANPKLKNSWIRILTSLGYANALPAIKEAISDTDDTVAANAIKELSRWPDPSPMEDLLAVVERPAKPDHAKLALASAIQLATVAAEEHQRPDAAIVGWLQRADKTAQSVESKRRILSVLGRLKVMESFRLAAPYLDQPDLQTEAAQAIVQIAPTLATQDTTGTVADALDKITARIQNTNIRNQAAKIASSIPKRPKALFDGKSLAGWEGNTNVWRVRDGVIVGGSMKGNPQNEFLATLGQYTNFVLRLEYKLVGTEGFVNGGVQFRSVRTRQPPNEMSGYQADIGAKMSGFLYDESRRNRVLVNAPEQQIKRLEKTGEWNQYEVRCAGPRIQIWLNGEKTVDYTETDSTIPQGGVIGLQIHGGCKAEIAFRNLAIAEIGVMGKAPVK